MNSAGIVIEYSRGTRFNDAYPENRTAENFAAFAEAVLSDRAEQKGLQYIAAAFKPNGDGRPHRCKGGALPSAFIAFDFDGFSSAEDWHATIEALQGWQGFAYTTASSTPAVPRARAVLAVSRPMDRTERQRVSLALQEQLNRTIGEGCINFDTSVYRAEQPIFCPPVNAETYRLTGQPVDVDSVLKDAPTIQARGNAKERAEAIATSDPVLAELSDRGMVRHEMDDGRYAIVCPFDSEHTEHTSDTATIYMLPNFGGVKYGKFDCKHAHCKDRQQPDYLKALGLEPSAVWKAQRGELGKEARDWPCPQPLPAGLPQVVSFDDALLPEAFRPWVQDIAERMQCPPDFPAVAAMVAASSVVGRQISIHPKRYDDWRVVPNLWGAIVGRPGMLKSPALNESRRMLERLEIRARELFELESAEHEAQKIIAAANRKRLDQEIAKAVKTGSDPSALAREAVEAEEESPPKRVRYVTNDSTVEKLGELLADNPRGVLAYRDELIGLLKSLDREGHEGSRAFYLECWNGDGAFRFDRIGRGTIEIEAACVSVLGGIQPGPLESYMHDAHKGGAGDDGLIQRFQLVVWPDAGGEWCNVDRWPNTAARTAAWEVFERLNTLDAHALGAECTDDELPALRFDGEAQQLFDEWRHELETRLRHEGMPPALEAHLSKYRSLAPSLALLLHLIDTPQGGAVGKRALLRALAWCQYLESHARRLYAQAINPEIAAAHELARRIHKGEIDSPFTARDVYRNGWRLLDRAGTQAALDVLADFDHVRSETLAHEKGGRPCVLWHINPNRG